MPIREKTHSQWAHLIATLSTWSVIPEYSQPTPLRQVSTERQASLGGPDQPEHEGPGKQESYNTCPVSFKASLTLKWPMEFQHPMASSGNKGGHLTQENWRWSELRLILSRSHVGLNATVLNHESRMTLANGKSSTHRQCSQPQKDSNKYSQHVYSSQPQTRHTTSSSAVLIWREDVQLQKKE